MGVVAVAVILRGSTLTPRFRSRERAGEASKKRPILNGQETLWNVGQVSVTYERRKRFAKERKQSPPRGRGVRGTYEG